MVLVSVQGVLSLVGSVQGSLSGGLCPVTGVCLSTGGGLSLGEEGLHPGGSLSMGVSVRETPLDRDPPYGNERAVRTLLECILAEEVSGHGHVNSCVLLKHKRFQ